MQNATTFRSFLSKKGYLLLLAAWLITISFVVDNYWSANASITTVTKQISAYLHDHEENFKKLVANAETIDKIRNENFSEEFLSGLIKRKYFIFFYSKDSISNEKLVCWNTQQVLPYASLLYEKKTQGFILLENGFYVWNRYDMNDIKAIALIPVKWNYIISNDYLENNFITDKSFASNYDVTSDARKGTAVKSITGKTLFYIQETSAHAVYKNNFLAVILQLLAGILFLLFIHFYAANLVITKGLWKGVLFLFISIIILRVTGYLFPVPVNFRQFELFDPAVYSASMVLRSLGDLLINVVFFVWFILFIKYHLKSRDIIMNIKIPYAKWIVLGVAAILIIIVTFTGSFIIRSLVADSKISFDVINFFTLDMYSVIGFIILCCIAIGHYFSCQVIVYFVTPFFPKNLAPLFLAISTGGLIMLTMRIGDLSGGFEIFVLLWLLLFLFLKNSHYLNMLASRIVSSRLVFWLFFFSISITAIIIVENNNKELRSRMHYAEILATKADPTTETLINTMLTVFRPDFLRDNFYRFYAEGSNQFLKDSLVNENMENYSNKYDTKVFTYDNDERPLYNADSTSYNEINTILNTQARPTTINGLYYYDKSYDMFSYISKKTLQDTSGNLVGYIFVLASPKRLKTDALYPELFSRGHDNSIENSSLYAFAVYNNNKLVIMHNDYSFPSVIKNKDFPAQQFKIVPKKNFSELWYNAGAGKIVVLAKENSVSIESITLFSYLFCSFLILTSLFWMINLLIHSGFNRNRLRLHWQLSIRNQIHGTIIFISVISFFVIGFATILFFIIRYENNNREKLSRTIHIMENEVKNSISGGWKIADSLRMETSSYGEALERTINKISEIHGVDVNLYDIRGNLKISSLPLPYIKGIVSTKMHPLAYYHLYNEKEVQYFQKENIGKLKFVSNYVPVRDISGNDYAYLNIPYFTSQSNLKQEISNFLVAIINLNAFIFLVAGIIALFITNRITNSFAVISDKMKKINLGSRNEAIEWKRNDELGQLVNEYNKMVVKLEESAGILAKTEREGAWREMARQVAHEIKNPLTPMKLGMQYLQKSIENNATNVKELTTSVANTLIEQIDHLSQIASDFSQFANIENAKKELIDINETLRHVLHLYAVNDHVEINPQLLNQPIKIEADKTHINRLFTNLILNAIQAVPENELAKISIQQSLENSHVLIEITDNGQGISEEIRTRIFTPNFTTKSSGTGLGLAMCKRIVEQAEGEIWFETALNKGTSFFIRFPLAV